MPTISNVLQAYWIDYEVWFIDNSALKYRNVVEIYLVIPTFANHFDVPGNTFLHSDHEEFGCEITSLLRW